MSLPVDRVPAADAAQILAFARESRPVVLTNVAASWRSTREWTPSRLAETCPDASRLRPRQPGTAARHRTRHPRRICRHEVILGPGDMLVLPPNWWHDVEALEPSISVNAWIVRPHDFRTVRFLANRARLFLHEAGVYARGRCTCHLTPDRPDVGSLPGWR